ncbi:MAG: IMP dehydrogenase, partial [Parascardovia denticolens]
MTQEIEIGMGKTGRLCYSLDDVAIIPNRRTRDPQDVNTHWQVDAYEFDIPVIGAPMDSIMSPQTVIELGKMGALGVLDLEGLWTRYEDPQPLLDKIPSIPDDRITPYLQKIYAEPIKADLIFKRLHQIRDAGVTVAGSLTPPRILDFYSTVLEAGVDLFVIRGSAVSAEHVSRNHEPLNLKKFIYELDVPVIVGGAGS